MDSENTDVEYKAIACQLHEAILLTWTDFSAAVEQFEKIITWLSNDYKITHIDRHKDKQLKEYWTQIAEKLICRCEELLRDKENHTIELIRGFSIFLLADRKLKIARAGLVSEFSTATDCGHSEFLMAKKIFLALEKQIPERLFFLKMIRATIESGKLAEYFEGDHYSTSYKQYAENGIRILESLRSVVDARERLQMDRRIAIMGNHAKYPLDKTLDLLEYVIDNSEAVLGKIDFSAVRKYGTVALQADKSNLVDSDLYINKAISYIRKLTDKDDFFDSEEKARFLYVLAKLYWKQGETKGSKKIIKDAIHLYQSEFEWLENPNICAEPNSDLTKISDQKESYSRAIVLWVSLLIAENKDNDAEYIFRKKILSSDAFQSSDKQCGKACYEIACEFKKHRVFDKANTFTNRGLQYFPEHLGLKKLSASNPSRKTGYTRSYDSYVSTRGHDTQRSDSSESYSKHYFFARHHHHQEEEFDESSMTSNRKGKARKYGRR